jgi:hypothetical protein
MNNRKLGMVTMMGYFGENQPRIYNGMTDKELLTIANHIGIMVCSTYHHGRTNTNGIDNDQKKLRMTWLIQQAMMR